MLIVIGHDVEDYRAAHDRDRICTVKIIYSFVWTKFRRNNFQTKGAPNDNMTIIDRDSSNWLLKSVCICYAVKFDHVIFLKDIQLLIQGCIIKTLVLIIVGS